MKDSIEDLVTLGLEISHKKARGMVDGGIVDGGIVDGGIIDGGIVDRGWKI